MQISDVVDARLLLLLAAELVLPDAVALLVVADPPELLEILYVESTPLFTLAGLRALLR